MNILDSLTFILAIWGAILSTVLGLIKIREYRRNLKIYLEWQAFYERCHLVIANNGSRPVTIKRIIVRSPEDGWAGFTVLEEGEEKKLPLKLAYGDEGTFILNQEVDRNVWTQVFELYVYDSEGNEYKPTLKREFSPRYEGLGKFEKL